MTNDEATPGTAATVGGSIGVAVDIDDLIESLSKEEKENAPFKSTLTTTATKEEAAPSLQDANEANGACHDDLDIQVKQDDEQDDEQEQEEEDIVLLGPDNGTTRNTRVSWGVNGTEDRDHSEATPPSHERRRLMEESSSNMDINDDSLAYIEDKYGNDANEYDDVADPGMDDTHVRLKKRLSIMERMQSKLGITDETKERLLPQDTFSIMIIAETCSLPSIAAYCIFTLQVSIFILVLLDLADAGEPGNRFGVPANVPPQLRATQFIAILVAVLTQGDLRTASILGRDGFTKDFDTAFMDTAKWKYWLSIVCRSFSGSVGLTVSFVLIITAPNVVELLLNFTAIEFVSSIDELCFYLSRQGFLGSHFKIYATTIANTLYRVSPESRMGFIRRSWKMLTIIFILTSFVAGWSIVVSWQVSGRYVCDTLFVQMGDDFVASLGTFNGLYDQGDFINGRMQYIERRPTLLAESLGRGIVEYCNDDEAWTFRIEDATEGESDPCQSWIAKSAETKTYDVLETAEAPWFVRDATNRVVALDPFGLACFDCDEGKDDDEDGFCGGKGTCSNAQCTCEEGWYGIQCEFRTPCSSLAVDERTENFASTRDWSAFYDTIELGDGSLVEAYHRPVYIHEYDSGDYDVVMFTGRRWALTSSEFLPRRGRIKDDELNEISQDNENIKTTGNDIGNFFHHIYHGYRGYNHETYHVQFLSDFMDTKTDNDASSPVGFQWSRAVSKERTPDDETQKPFQDVSTEFLCSVCNNGTNPCLYDGKCVERVCVCSLDSTGSLCEIPPVKNGHCDVFFNTPEFKQDGGDCCESTCTNSEKYVCGAEEEGYVNTGYFSCTQNPTEWQEELLDGKAGSFAGFSVDLSLGSIAVGELLQDRVVIYDKVGSSWEIRDTMDGEIGSFFGTRVALSAGRYNVVSNPSFLAPLTVVVHDGFRQLKIYKCDLEGCTLFQEMESVYLFHLSADGTVLATSFLNTDPASWPPHVVTIYESIQGGQFAVRSQFPIAADPNNMTRPVWSMAQSGDGSNLVLQTQIVEIDPELNTEISRGETFEVYNWNGAAYVLDSQIPYKASFNAWAYEFSLGMSQDGSVLAFGVADCFDRMLTVLDRGSNNSWVPRPSAPINETDCTDSLRPKRNNNLALSQDGSTVAFRLGNVATVYKWESEEWEKVGDGFPNTHYPVALSSDGKEVAIGAPADGIGGITGVYKLPARKVCPEGTKLLRISLTLDRLPDEHYWDLKNTHTGETVYRQGPYPKEYAFGTIAEETCVDVENHCFEFAVYSDRNRGLQAPGMYALLLEDIDADTGEETFKDVGRGSFDGLFAKESVGNCSPCPDGLVPFELMMITCAPVVWEFFEAIDVTAFPPVVEMLANGTTYEEPTDNFVFPSCGGQRNEPCYQSPVEPLTQQHKACVDPGKCYGVAIRQTKNAISFLELELDGNKTFANEFQVCNGNFAAVGNGCPELTLDDDSV